MSKFSIKSEVKNLKQITLSLDRKIIIIFITVAILQTISWYYTSRGFFRLYIFPYYEFNPNVYLYEYLYWYLGDFFTLFVLPVLIIKLILKENLKDFGLTAGDYKAGFVLTIIFLVIMLPLVWIFSSYPDFVRTYPQLVSVRDNWNTFLIFEAGLIIYLVAWEFIWRGFMLFGLKGKFGYYAIFIQMIPFLILHNGKPVIETFGAIVAGIALGVLAWRTVSVYYCIITHGFVMVSIDLVSTLRYRTQDYGIGINSILNILKHIF
ncbi:MAG TPA: CPBP family intramembrane glutamic endopeptidase [Ignavibacteriaceae bacterium]|nr:CPBP family intramembrane glutamic endopeptidase [Ignavibacteriaceae bacterium]